MQYMQLQGVDISGGLFYSATVLSVFASNLLPILRVVSKPSLFQALKLAATLTIALQFLLNQCIL